jgi:serine/threonine protein kinase
MSSQQNPDPAVPRAGTDPKRGHQDTVLLSDVPDAASLLNEAAQAPVPIINLTSTSLAALGQRYDILAEAGHGSMGNVYKARDRETGEIVALKLLKPEIASDQAMMERFKNELLFARKITHKNVCRVHDFNRIGGIAYTSMEFVEGESLRSVMNRFGGLPVKKAVGVALQICSGLKEAHAQGIVHRDLKPENVMIDANGNVKIMDFGIARSMEAGTRLTGSMVGTPAYMAPEQVAGKPVDYRTDIYSLGLMLYEMFTGTPAFSADTPVAVALKQLRETPPAPHEIEPTIPVGIERAILKCLEKEPAKRFQSVAELEQVLSGPGTTATSRGVAPVIAPLRTAPPLVHLPSPPTAQEKGSHGSVIGWVLLGGFLVFVGLGWAQWAKSAKLAELIPPPPLPATLAAPKPPDFALNFSTPAAVVAAATPKPAEPKPVAKKPAEKKADAAETAKAQPPASTPATEPAKPVSTGVFPRVELPGKPKSARQQQLESDAPPPVQQRADKAFGESAKPADSTGWSYLWVGRYQTEDKAQQVVKKIHGFGLPVVAMPRSGNDGQFWIVVTGPFNAKRLSDVTQWLEAQGYLNVHEIKWPGKPAGNSQPQQ